MSQQSDLPVAYTIFCDDFRQEVGNKISYMGVYQGMMFVQAFPFKAPRLCAAITVRFQRDQAPPGLVFKLFLQDTVVATRLLDLGSLAVNRTSEPGVDAVFATTLFQIVPFSVEESALLTSRVYFDDHELNAGELAIRALPSAMGPLAG